MVEYDARLLSVIMKKLRRRQSWILIVLIGTLAAGGFVWYWTTKNEASIVRNSSFALVRNIPPQMLAMMNKCREQLNASCGEIRPGDHRLKRCLQESDEQWSPDCRGVFRAIAEKTEK